MNVATDGVYAVDSGSLVTSNFMEHGTLAARIRLEDYRPFLLTLYGNLCFAMDSGNRFAPEDAVLPGSFAGEGRSWTWSSVVNSVLQPTLALRWLLCYEEQDSDIVHLQKAAPKHWFATGQRIVVARCPTRFGLISWSTEAVHVNGEPSWRISLTFPELSLSRCTLVMHIHPADSRPLRSSSLGELGKNMITIPYESLAGKQQFTFEVK